MQVYKQDSNIEDALQQVLTMKHKRVKDIRRWEFSISNGFYGYRCRHCGVWIGVTNLIKDYTCNCR